MKRNISQERRELIENAVGNISDRFIREVYEKNNKTTASGKHRAAPAWARPLAASVCAILAVGLLILSIPVVNNIITNRGTGALPADTPEVEQTAAFENTDAPKETVAPVETEKPGETEKDEETVEETDPYYRKRVISRLYIDLRNRNEKGEPAKVPFLITATLSDFLKDENRREIITAEQLDKMIDPDKVCEEGKYLNPLTNRCKKYEIAEEKVCDEGYYLNPDTNRCKKIKDNDGAEYSVNTNTDGVSSFAAFIAVIIVVVVGLIYIVYEFRHEIKRLFDKVFRRAPHKPRPGSGRH